MPLSIKVHITICIFNTKKSLFPTYDVSQVVQGLPGQIIEYLYWSEKPKAKVLNQTIENKELIDWKSSYRR
jgi:hypothetical protein